MSGSSPSTVSVTTGSHSFIAPYVAEMDASGAAAFEYVQQETVSIAGIKYIFDRTINAGSSINLLNCFTVSGHGPSGDFTVSLSDPDTLRGVLIAAIEGNTNRNENGKSATEQFRVDLAAALKEAIGADDLINTVENLDVTDVEVTLDSSGGASNMVDNLTDARCNLIYTQIPKENLNQYMDASENQVTSALPLLKGDSLTFVFNVDVADVVPTKTQRNTGADATALSDPLSGTALTAEGGLYNSSLHYNMPSVRIAIVIKLTEDASAPFTSSGASSMKA